MAAEKQRLRKKGSRIRIAFTPHINVLQNKASIQLLIRGCQVRDENSEGAA
jgi:hypothetical protein